MNPTLLRLLGLLGALALPLSAQTVTTTLLNDTFADGDRTNQSPPTSSQWFTSGSNSTANIDASGGALVTKNGLTNLTYFAAADAPVALAVGESLTLTFNVSFTAVADSAGSFRVGLFDSGTRLSADNFGNGNAAFSDSYAGYMGVANTGATTNNILRYYERGASNTNLMAGSIGGYGQVGSFGGPSKTFVVGSVYTGVLTLTRTDETTLNLSQSYTGVFGGDSVSSTVSGSVNDASASTWSFDTLGFFYNTTSGYTLDNIKVDYTGLAQIPEPSAAAALVGALALSAGAVRRRRRA